MKLKELVSKMENVGYVLKDENGNEVNSPTPNEESKLMEQNVISFDVVKEDLEITIEMPKPKVKQTFTPKFNLGQNVYHCSINFGSCNHWYAPILNDGKIKVTKINGVKFTNYGTRYDIDCNTCHLVCENELFETKEELIEHINKMVKIAVEQLEEI